MRFNAGGITLIVLGILFLLQNFNILAWDALWKFWPIILVALGVSLLLPKRS